MAFFDNFKHKKNLIASHRGFRSIRAENTLPAFKASLGKCDFIEFDVSITKDGVPVIIHDNTLHRTSNIKQRPDLKNKTFIHEFTLKDLKSLDLSTWFKRKDPFKTIKNKLVNKNEIRKDKILTLRELLKFCKINNLYANIEIKDLTITPFDKIIVSKIIEVIKEIKMEDFVLLSSFKHIYLKEAKNIAPMIQRAALVEDKHPDNILEYLKDLDVCAYNCDDEIINGEIITLLNENNYYVNVFTVNSKQREKELFELGVKSIYTDFLL